MGKDRFAGLSSASGSHDAAIRTAPVILTKSEIKINANIEGSLRAQLSDPFGGVIPGYEYANSVEIKGDSINHNLAWKGKNLEELQYKGLVIELLLNGGVIYSMDI
jgi:hypothetical protein